jgi:NodT family efflux transporter outer membrane factor (OMF) lipoprotein
MKGAIWVNLFLTVRYSLVALMTRKTSSLHGFVLSFLALSLLTACAPDLGPLPQPKSEAALASQKSFTAPAAEWPAQDWWTAYKDPQLNALIAEGLAGSPDIRIAEARVKEADAAAQQSGAALYPQLKTQGEVSEFRESLSQGFPKQFESLLPRGWHSQGQFTANANYDLDLFGANRAAFAAATSDADAAAVDLAAARLTLSTAIATAYANLVQLVADRTAAQESLSERDQSTELVRQRQSQQLENEGELSQARSRSAGAKADLDVIDGQIALARNQLAALVGKGPDRGLDVTLPTAVELHPVGVPSTLGVDLIGRRPDIVAARLRAQSASSRIKVAHAAYYPNISLTGDIGYSALGIGSLISPVSMLGQIGPAISLPIFDGGKIEGGYRNARAQYDEVVANYDKTLTQALHDVADVLANQRELAAELADAKVALTESENAYRIATLRYQGGLSRYLDVLTSEDTLVVQRRRVADLQARAFGQDVALVHALGGGFETNDAAVTAKN